MASSGTIFERKPPQNPTLVPWDPWVDELEASGRWRLSGHFRAPSISKLFEDEGLASFTSDHPNNPVTSRMYELVSGPGPIAGAIHFDERAQGAAGYIHEGAVGAAVDGLLGFCNIVNNAGGPTLNLTLRFHKPIPLGVCLRSDCQLLRTEGKKIFLQGSVVDGSNTAVEYVHCTALWFNAFAAAPNDAKFTPPSSPDIMQSMIEALTGLSKRYPNLQIGSSATVMSTPWVADLVAKGQFRRCTELLECSSGVVQGCHFINGSTRIKAEYFTGPDAFLGAFQVCGQCMGPPPNVHGGCIFSLHAETVISCVRVLASAYGCTAKKGRLTLLSVNYRKLTPLWYTYGVRVRIVECRPDTATMSWTFRLRSEMSNPDETILHSDADAEFVCSEDGQYDLLDANRERDSVMQLPAPSSML